MMRPCGSPPAVALAVGAVLHHDQAELDQMAIEVLHLAWAETQLLLLHRRGWPHDRPGGRLPIDGIREPKEPVDGVHDAWPQPEIRCGGFECGQYLAGVHFRGELMGLGDLYRPQHLGGEFA